MKRKLTRVRIEKEAIARKQEKGGTKNRDIGSGGGYENIQQQIFEIEDICLGIEESKDMRMEFKRKFWILRKLWD